MLDFFRIAKSTYFYTIKTFNRIDNDKPIKDLIKAIFNENKARYGYRRITLELKNRGYQINHKKVKRLMKMARYVRIFFLQRLLIKKTIRHIMKEISRQQM